MLKVVVIILIIILGLTTGSIIVLSINQQMKLKKESKSYPYLGEMVKVDDKFLHVYQEGEGDYTFIFLSGHGTSAPTLDFKPLWKKLSEENRIVVVERFGYGFSDLSNNPKDLNTILEETRFALSELNILPPYVLVPHSISGLQAIYWAQKYKDEVVAIIGLDPCVPDAIPLLPIPSKMELNLVHFISRIGLSRLMPKESLKLNLPLLDSEDLTDDEKKMYEYLFYRSSLTKDMLKELNEMHRNAELINNLNLPKDTPMYFFISDIQNQNVDGWTDALKSFLDQINTNQSLILNKSHYVHHHHSEQIYQEIMSFLSQ